MRTCDVRSIGSKNRHSLKDWVGCKLSCQGDKSDAMTKSEETGKEMIWGRTGTFSGSYGSNGM